MLLGISAVQLAAAAELLYLRYRPSVSVTEDAVVLAEKVGDRLGYALDLRLVRYHQVSRLLRVERSPGDFAELSAMFFNEAVDAGWIPVLRRRGEQNISLYQLAATNELITTVGTPPRQSMGATVSRAVFGHEYRYVEYADHANCLRSVLTQQNVGCMTPTDVAEAYANRLGVQLREIAGPFQVPAPVLFASPFTSGVFLERAARLADMPGAQYQRFTDADARNYQNLIRTLSQY